MTALITLWILTAQASKDFWVLARPGPPDNEDEGHRVWSTWTQWSACTRDKVCYSGTRQRKRWCQRTDDFNASTEHSVCVGPFDEQEDCPTSKCTRSKLMIYQDVTEAPLSSFISQECDTDAKFAVASERGQLIPPSALVYCQNHLNKFLNGYFNIKKLTSKKSSSIGNMTKVCFEPNDLSVADVTKIGRFNRVVRASLNADGKLHASDSIAGVAIVVSDKGDSLQGLYFAVPSNRLGYKKVGYRRWRGVGVLDAL